MGFRCAANEYCDGDDDCCPLECRSKMPRSTVHSTWPRNPNLRRPAWQNRGKSEHVAELQVVGFQR